MMNVSTLRPGLLVSLKSTLSGNVSYTKRDIETDHVAETGERRAKWETDRVIANPEEHDAAIKARGKARALITSVCSHSSFGLLCPEANGEELLGAVREARALIADFNATAGLSQVSLYVIIGRVAPDDVEAVRAINGEMRDLIEEMERGLRNLDVKAVRDAASRARALASMLTPEAAQYAKDAIDLARSAARQIVKAGETAAAAIDEEALLTLRASRTMFLDLDEGEDVREPEVAGRAVDFDLEPVPAEVTIPVAPRPAIEIEL